MCELVWEMGSRALLEEDSDCFILCFYDDSSSSDSKLSTMLLTYVPPKGTVVFYHVDQFPIPVTPLMQEKVQLKGTTGKCGKSAWSLYLCRQ